MKKLILWLPALAWMGFIFQMSAASGDVSDAQSGQFVSILQDTYVLISGHELSPGDLETTHMLLRKAAHMTEYAVLSLLYVYAFRKSGARRPALSALLLCVLYAACDELHQAFVPDRSPSPVDVLIDTAGASLALAARQLFLRLSARRSKAP